MTAALGRDCGPMALCYCPVAEGANMSQQMDARNIVLSELQPGEVLRWSGQPTALAMLLSNAMNIGFGIVFAIVGGTRWVRSCWTAAGPIVFLWPFSPLFSFSSGLE